MVSVMQPFMDVESSRSYIDELYSPDFQKCLGAIICLKNSVIGSNRQKGSVIAQGVVPRLLQLLGDTSGTAGDRLRLESAVTLGSLAKGTDQHVLALIDLGVVPLILQVLLSVQQPVGGNFSNIPDLLIEACLRCLRTIFQHSGVPVQTIYQDPTMVSRLLVLSSCSITCQVCVATILTTACKIGEDVHHINPCLWNKNENYLNGLDIVKHLNVVSDVAEPAVHLLSDYNDVLTKNEEQIQFVVKSVKDYQNQLSDAKKTTMMERYYTFLILQEDTHFKQSLEKLN